MVSTSSTSFTMLDGAGIVDIPCFLRGLNPELSDEAPAPLFMRSRSRLPSLGLAPGLPLAPMLFELALIPFDERLVPNVD